MGIGVRCEDCGHRHDVEESFAGSELQCFNCGQTFRVPGTPPPKQCFVCRKDITTAQRTKDPQGNYYCIPCWEASLKAYKALPTQVQDQARQRRQAERAESDWLRLLTGWLNIHYSWKVKLALGAAGLGVLVGAYFVHTLALSLAATALVLGVGMLAVYFIWELGMPFRDGSTVGRDCLLSRHHRRQWQEYNRDFRLRQPGRFIVVGLGLIGVGVLAFLAGQRTAPRGVMVPEPPAAVVQP